MPELGTKRQTNNPDRALAEKKLTIFFELSD
jgi:hypothetical protein